jgi:AraC-like DNA-binding protein
VSRPGQSGGLTLYDRIGYATDLEAEALERLAALDVPGCRSRFGQLLAGLDLSRVTTCERQVTQLLLDVLQKVNRQLHPTGALDGSYQRQRMRLIEEFAGCPDAAAARDRFMAALNRLLADLDHSSRSVHRVVRQAELFIQHNYHRRICLSSVAAQLNVSANYLSRLFRQEAGVTLTTYIHRLRLEHARLLLADVNRTIAEIAYRVGYQNYRDFYRNFVKHVGLSPSEVRNGLSADVARHRPPRPAAERVARRSGRSQFWSSSEPSV